MMLSAGNGFIMQSDKYSRDNAGQSLKKYTLLKKGELAYNHGASKAKQFGCCYELREEEARIPYVYHCFKVRGTEYAPYVALELNNTKMDKQLKRLVSSSVRMDGLLNISYDEYMSVVVYLPAYAEQKHIADFLEKLDMRIAKQKQLVESLKKYKRGLISDILKQNLAVSHESEKWEEVSLNDVADGFEYGMNAAATTFDGAHKYIRITDIDDDSHTYIDCDPVSPSGVLEEKYRVRDNDILFARTGASVGKSYLYRKTDGDLFFAGFLIRIHVKDGIDSEYVFLNTLTEEYAKWVLLESARSGQPGINAEQYRRYRFKLPSLRIQKRIASIAQKLDSQIQRESMCLHLLQEQKRGLLQQLFI